MGISVCVGEFMMNTMIAHPLQDIFLRWQCLKEDQEVFEFFVSAVGAMCKVAMCTRRDAKGSAEKNNKL